MKGKIAVILIICLALFACNGRYDEEKDFESYFPYSGEVAVITGYIGSKTHVRIPPKINKRPVTRIGESAFKEKGLTSVIIPKTVTSISDGVKTLSVDGVAPTRQNIQNNNYPFVQTVYAITTGNESENARRFIEWILSSQGQELVAKTGYTSIK